MTFNRRVLVESAGVALGGYAVAATLEALLIRWIRPTEWELAWVSDVTLAVALGVAVYLWRHLLTTRHELAERERAELVLEAQLSLAAEIQRRLLPVPPPLDSGFESAAALRSAGRIGGDFFDFVESAAHVWFVLVADVSGKGIPAAMALGSLRAAFRTFVHQGNEPARIVSKLSAHFLREWRGVPYVTCIVAAFDLQARTLLYTNAGHPPGMLVGSNGARRLNRGGPPAGLLPDAQFEQELAHLSTGDTCLFVSDGVTESLDDEFALDRELAASAAACSATELCDRVMARALNGKGPSGYPEWDDDRTVVVVRVADPMIVRDHDARPPVHDSPVLRLGSTPTAVT